MLGHIKKSWVTKTLSLEEINAYTSFQESLALRFSLEHKESLEQSFGDLVREIAANLHEDPRGEIGQALAKRSIELTKHICGPAQAELRTALWQNGFKKGGALAQTSPKILSWIDKAMDAYWSKRIRSLLNEVDHLSNKEVAQRWEQILDAMCGDDQIEKDGIVNAALKDNQVNTVAKTWLQNNYGVKF